MIDLQTQDRIGGMFDVLRALDDGEWASQITDDGNPAVCPSCSGFDPNHCRHVESLLELGCVGHKPDCSFPKARRNAFREAVTLADTIPDGNLVINLMAGLYLGECR